MRRVVLVTGPPCAGKSTYVARHAQPGDLVLDQDRIGKTAMARALTAVAAMPDGAAWVIRCCPGRRARTHLAQQIRATELVHLVDPLHTLIHRASTRPHPRRHVAAITAWFTRDKADTPPATRGAVKPRGSTTARGYGSGHQKARARAVRGMEDGALCPRCGKPMWRSQAAGLDLDHTEDRSGYQGLAHARCNRSAGQAKATRNRRARVASAQPTRRSRNW